MSIFFFQAEDGIRDYKVTGVQTCALPISYRVTRRFPRDELYGLTSQIRRSAASVCANIAEGCGRSSRRDFARFLHVAQGSASELEYHWILALDLGLVDQTGDEQITAGVTDVKRMLTGLVRRLERTARAAR